MFVKIKKLTKINKSNTCFLSKKIYDSLSLSKDKKYKIKLGSISKNIYIYPKETNESIMYFPKNIFNHFLLFSDIKLNIWKKNNELLLGPVIAVFVNDRYIKKIKNSNPSINCLKYIQANEVSNCLTYFFSIDDINYTKRKINGFVFDLRQNAFRRYLLPFPDVIYDKGINFKKSKKILVKKMREQFKYDLSIEFINNKDYLDKWYLYKRLNKYEEIKKYLPQTIRYRSFKDVEKMINKYSFIFIKSFYGSKGKEVMAINKVNNKYITNFYNKGIKKIIFTDLKQLEKHVKSFIKDNKFIVQQGIELSKYNKRKFDLRILIEKDIHGKWVTMCNLARVAKEKTDITNCSTGAEVLNYSYIYNKMNNNKLPYDKDIRQKAILIAQYIEKEYGSFGELGMDMAVDKNGHIWFIESNTKPDKSFNKLVKDTNGISPQFLSIFNYSKFITKKGE